MFESNLIFFARFAFEKREFWREIAFIFDYKETFSI